MRQRRAFVIGAGMAGLSAATALAEKGVHVELIEAAGQAGGRCRSYSDPAFDAVIDNGNHLVLSGNHAVFDFLRRIGAEDKLAGPEKPVFDFADLGTGERWTLALNDGALPWWIAAKARRLPGTGARDYARFAALLWAGPKKTVGEAVSCEGAVWERLMRPFLLASLNTRPEISSAALAGAVIRESLARGGRACRPRIAVPSLGAAFVDPALGYLKARGGSVRFGQRLRTITFARRHASAIDLPEATIPLGPRDALILAVPPFVAQALVPDLRAPEEFCAIVNAHFNIPAPPGFIKEDGVPRMLGLIGGTAEWIFGFADRISVTVSAADALIDKDREELARILWKDVCAGLGFDAPLPPWQIVKEKRATFAATPRQDALRPAAKTRWRNFFLAGDWIQTGLPATIEGAVRSGEKAASLALRHLGL